ncbi:ribosome biogenesis factor YjgA [Mangrovitalea sediminis]|uniref:ribosome biogenesis factor YjgA n=1 Tax=Mangrovitalea sediminis TaxID=1982043 RepID=UPI000BE5BC02|nr:ribosome biogenesis factor YjgA [Mangrovitalea sediminis]
MRAEENDFDTESDELKSKSQLKREMQQLQELGKKLGELDTHQLEPLPISDRLRSALDEFKRIRQHEARRRHLQYIGKLMRSEDYEVLEKAVEGYSAGSQENTRRLHLAEHWRERLIAEGDSAMADFMEQVPGGDVQHLRNLIRNARKDAALQKNTGHARKLFREIRDLIDQAET